MKKSLDSPKPSAVSHRDDHLLSRQFDRRALMKLGLFGATAAALAPKATAAFGVRQGGVCGANPIIAGTSLMQTGNGLELTITGTDLGDQVGNLCVLLTDGQNITPTRVTAVSPTSVTTIIDSVTPGQGESRVMLAQGSGADTMPGTLPFGFTASDTTFGWFNTGEPMTLSATPLTLPTLAPQPQRAGAMITSHAGTIDPASGSLIFDVTDSGPNCGPGDSIALFLDARLSSGEVLAVDFRGPLDVNTSLPLSFCVNNYCDFFRDALLARTSDRLEAQCAGLIVNGRTTMQIIGLLDRNTGMLQQFVSGYFQMAITSV